MLYEVITTSLSLTAIAGPLPGTPIDYTVTAPVTRAPGPFSTGIDSPVTIDSSTALVPSTTTPSTGISNQAT